MPTPTTHQTIEFSKNCWNTMANVFGKHRGLADFPMGNGFSLWEPSALAQRATVILCLRSLVPLAGPVAKVLFGSSLKNNPVSSML